MLKGVKMGKIVKALGEFLSSGYFKAQLKNFYTLAFDYGQLRTIREKRCIDKLGNPIPWYTYPAIEYLKTIDFSRKLVFEYGGGSSTLWWAVGQKGCSL